MLVGPHDPIFDARYRIPDSSGELVGPSHPSGARWDPIGPPGTPGFLPDQERRRTPPSIHPDIMQPGPGRSSTGADFGFM